MSQQEVQMKADPAAAIVSPEARRFVSTLVEINHEITSILDLDPLLERTERRPKAAAPGKRGKAAWSRVEDVLAERQLEKELRDIFEDE